MFRCWRRFSYLVACRSRISYWLQFRNAGKLFRPISLERRRKPIGSSWLSRSYIGRHWRGELSLPISFFVNVVAIGIAEFAIVFVLSDLIFADFNPTLAIPFIVSAVFVSLIELIIVAWQVVGTWRSARRLMVETGQTFYALLAETLLAIYVLTFVGQFAWITISQIKAVYAVAAGEDTGTFRITILNESEIEFAGIVTYGAAEALRNVLDSTPAVKTIHLNSLGGILLPAKRLRDVVRDNKLDTYTRTECSSGCAIVYLGGKRRYLHRSGRLGFHRSSQRIAKRSEVEMVDDAVAFGVDRHFAKRAFSVAHRDIWYPELQELIDAKYVTHTASGQFAISGFEMPPKRPDLKAELLLKTNYAAAHEAEPASLDQILDIYVEVVLNREPEWRARESALVVVNRLIWKNLPYVSDEALISYASDTAMLAKYISAIDPAACSRFLKLERVPLIDSQKDWTPEMLDIDMRRTATVLRSKEIHEKRNRDPVSQDVVDALYQKTLDGLAAKNGAETVRHFNIFRENPEKLPKKEYCGVLSASYEQILTLPKSEAAVALRDLFSSDK